ncbi:hypothetical protein EV217_5073 [Phyllobacterium myrsinacearum]|uniref:hypothetical protein n=1 Tax=Phyllobacterium myrsinacearum TaxID=28101 RepID=UPI00102A5759|nr:hypothetical protein [Phyllobacterium myrsinacearum]RZS76842.1 hypothetical protein EV217_5073 [Phyllobacterium myrsinacearum]
MNHILGTKPVLKLLYGYQNWREILLARHISRQEEHMKQLIARRNNLALERERIDARAWSVAGK